MGNILEPETDILSDIGIDIDSDFGLEFEDEKREKGTLTYHSWRNAVFGRDSYICQKCNKEFAKDELEAHHIKPYSISPELQFDINNGLTLCHNCHVKTDTYGRRQRKKMVSG